ncbi:MAG: hypothetical protein ABI618_01110 [Nitrospirota bacterium]
MQTPGTMGLDLGELQKIPERYRELGVTGQTNYRWSRDNKSYCQIWCLKG